MTEYGLQIYNSDGTLRDKVTSNFPRIITVIGTEVVLSQTRMVNENAAEGSRYVPELEPYLNNYRIFAIPAMYATGYSCLCYPKIWFDGATVHWSWRYLEHGVSAQSYKIYLEFNSNAPPGDAETYMGGIPLIIGVVPNV